MAAAASSSRSTAMGSSLWALVGVLVLATEGVVLGWCWCMVVSLFNSW
jgi:hypothetical protein